MKELPMEGPIIITGCQRSGTMFISQLYGLKYKCVVWDESQWLPLPNQIDKLQYMVENGVKELIIQAPAALVNFPAIFHKVPGVHFVGVQRDTEEIIKSMKRIKWLSEEFYHWPDFMYDHIQYMSDLWDSLKRILPPESWTEVKYDDFKDNPLYIPENERKDFTVKQWQRDKPIGPQYWESER